MKRIFISFIFSSLLSTSLFANLQYFSTNNSYEKLIAIKFIKSIKHIKDIKTETSCCIYEHKYIPFFTYQYKVITYINKYIINCKKKINFYNINNNFLKQYKCKIIKSYK